MPVPTLQARQVPEVDHRCERYEGMPLGPADAEALLVQGPGLGQVAVEQLHVAQAAKAPGRAERVLDRAVKVEGFGVREPSSHRCPLALGEKTLPTFKALARTRPRLVGTSVSRSVSQRRPSRWPRPSQKKPNAPASRRPRTDRLSLAQARAARRLSRSASRTSSHSPAPRPARWGSASSANVTAQSRRRLRQEVVRPATPAPRWRTGGQAPACGTGSDSTVFRDATRSDLSTRAATRSNTSASSTAPKAHTPSAAARLHPPAKTDSRPNSSRSAGDSRSKLQSRAARSDWWRRGAVRGPRRAHRCGPADPRDLGGGRPDVRAAASSMASGMPSSRQHHRSSKAATRPTRRRSPSWNGPLVAPSSARADRGRTASPTTLSGSRLVAKTCTPGAAWISRWTRSAQASTTCSQLSRTSKTRRSRRWSARTSVADRIGSGLRPTAPATCSATRPASASDASSIQ